MLVASDTSPLSNLAIIGRLSLLPEQFAEVWMPPAVARELTALGSVPAQAAIAEATRTGWLKMMPLPISSPFPAELRGLDAGETEALRMALCLSARQRVPLVKQKPESRNRTPSHPAPEKCL